jgi:hypothetical protein
LWGGSARSVANNSPAAYCTATRRPHIKVRTEQDAVVLIYQSRSLLDTEWKLIEQRVSITWNMDELPFWWPPSLVRNMNGALKIRMCRRCY